MMSAQDTPTILFVVGSLRKDSLNRQLAEQAIALLGDQAHVELLDWSAIPVFSQDIEFPAPDQVSRVRALVEKADALWIASPEYNHGVPGGLKNLIDWLSRPLANGDPGVIGGKLVTVSTVAGSSCGRYAHAALLPTFDFLGMKVIDAPLRASSSIVFS